MPVSGASIGGLAVIVGDGARWSACEMTIVVEQEDDLSRADQTELATRDLLDGHGVFREAARFGLEGGVLGPQEGDLADQRVVVAAGGHRPYEPTVADHGVGDHQACNEEDQHLEPAPCVGRGPLGERPLPGAAVDGGSVGHASQ